MIITTVTSLQVSTPTRPVEIHCYIYFRIAIATCFRLPVDDMRWDKIVNDVRGDMLHWFNWSDICWLWSS